MKEDLRMSKNDKNQSQIRKGKKKIKITFFITLFFL